MNDRTLVIVSRVVALVTVACGVISVIVLVASDVVGRSTTSIVMQMLGTIIVPVVVWITVPKAPRNGSVWAFAVVGLSLGLVTLGDSVALGMSGVTSEDVNLFTVEQAPADLPLPSALGLTIAMSVWIVTFVLLPTMVLLLFPDGRYPSPRRWWRWVGVLSVATIGIGMFAQVWIFLPTSTSSYADLARDSVGASSSPSLVGFIAGVASIVAILLIAVSIIGYALKWKRARGDVRMQYRWVGFAFFVYAINSLVTVVLSPFGGNQVSDVASWAAIVLIPIAYVVAILKYKLYGIEVVISKTVTYGVLAVFITGVYALMVVGVGSLLGGGGESDLVLSIVAVAIVAIAFEPLRRRVQHWANLLVYGRRATPYEVLASATARLSESRDPDEALAEVTRLVVDGTGASEVVLWLVVGDVIYPRTATPTTAISDLDPAAITDSTVEAIPGNHVVAVRHRGEVLGALSMSKGQGEVVSSAEENVLADVAAGAGVLLRNISLNAELAKRAEQLQVSRRRLVAAQDAERHRLERDLHDGAQQQVVALKVKLGIARTIAEREGAEAVAGFVASLADTTQEAVDGMRAVAHGIYPPLLESEGLEAALNAAKRTIPVPVEIVSTGIGRYERPVAESAYFAVLGTVTQAVDAGATRAVISLTGTDDNLRFTVDVDVAPGDLVAVEDRIDALDGTLTVTTNRAASVITGLVPARVPTLEPA